VQLALDSWREVYNQERTHQALDYRVPARAYVASLRPLPYNAPGPEYLSTDEIRRVQGQGEISFRGHLVHIGRAFSGDAVALLAAEEDGVWSVLYYKQRVGTVDLRSPLALDV